MGERIRAGDVDLWVERHGDGGPEVLLIGGLGDTAEAWQSQLDGLADRYRLTAFDNRGAGRSPSPDAPLTASSMAADAAALLRALNISSAHVAGFSMGSAIAQELAIGHRELVRSLVLVSTYARTDTLFRSLLGFWRWLPEAAPNERAFVDAFFTWVYSPRAHEDGSVGKIAEGAIAFPYPQSVDDFQAQVDACLTHDTTDRLSRVGVPTLILAGEYDLIFPPRFGRAVASLIPHARFEVWPEQAHQPFQEMPDEFNDRVDTFWREVEAST